VSSSSVLELGAPAKLNLFLEVLGRRDDGYHELDSVFAEIDLRDYLRIEPADTISLTVAGPAAANVPADETNLCWKAAAALGVGAEIALTKHIPAGSGLGGGSSDAAAVLLALDGLHGLGLPDERLFELARGLGADVPFFLVGGLARCRGIGDEIEPLSAPGRRYLVVVPELHMSTAEVFAALGPGLTEKRETATVFAKKYCGGSSSDEVPYFNRLQGAAERLEPRMSTVRQQAEAYFGLTCTMTGSGSAYFAEIGDGVRVDAERAEDELGPVRVLVVSTGRSTGM
jgi:4-diphosphocytidyl-2-C-methyl-D-erythritol kinase